MALLPLTDGDIREHAADGSYDRGVEYHAAGAVLERRDDGAGTIEASVKGSALLPYVTRIRYDDAGVTSVRCSCPYHAGGWCKHVVAVLLDHLAAHADGRAALARRLDALDASALRSLLLDAAAHDDAVLSLLYRLTDEPA